MTNIELTEKEKNEFLLKDICSRLPYGLKAEIGYTDKSRVCEVLGVSLNEHTGLRAIEVRKPNGEIDYIRIMLLSDMVKPYLRSMPSLTEDEKRDFNRISGKYLDEYLEADDYKGRWDATMDLHGRSIDYLNSIHVDYRGLIPAGLALEATNETYPKSYKSWKDPEYRKCTGDERTDE